MNNIVPAGENIIKLGLEAWKGSLYIWLKAVDKATTEIYVAVAVGSLKDREVLDMAKKAGNNEMYVLRCAGFEMPKGFQPTVTEEHGGDKTFQVTMYRFEMTAWKRGIMKGWFDKAA